MDSKRLTDERLKELAKPLGDNCWGVTEREGNEMARELLLLRADAAELAQELEVAAFATRNDFPTMSKRITKLLSRPSVVNLLKEKDQ